MTMNCLAKPTQRTGEPEAPARASVPERFRRLKWNEVVWSGEAPAVFRAGSFARPIYRKEETERFRPASTRKPKQNAKHRDENTKNHCVLETNLRLERGRPRHFGKITICPTKIAIIINNPLNYTEILEKSGQSLSPCVEVNGHMLADVNGDEVEAYLLEAGVLHLTAAVADAPANWACDAHHHE
jgi:hypothetical protein